MLSKRSIWLPLILCSALAPFAGAQAISIRVVVGDTGTNVDNGGTVSIAAEGPRTPTTATVTLTNRSAGSLTINRPAYSGSTDFVFSGLPEENPVALPANQSLSFSVRYTPSSSDRKNASVQIPVTDARNTSAQLTLNFVGTSPEYAASFTPQGGNATPVVSGGTITFPLTAVNGTSTTLVVITNRGTAPGKFKSAAVTGAPFQLVGVPLVDTAIPAGGDLRFQVQFQPKQLAPENGTLSVQAAGAQWQFALASNASAPQFQAEVVEPNPGPIAPGSVIKAPDTPVGEKSTMVLRVRNTGNADGQITSIAVQGAAFQLADVPFLPLTLTPGAAAGFRLIFAPTEAGPLTGRLRIGDDSYAITGTALGVALTYSFVVGETATTVASNGNVVFTPAAVGRSSDLEFRIANTGTQAASINSIAIAGPNVFTLVDAPSFPAQLAAGATLPVKVRFAPTALGSAVAVLRVDNSSFNLTGSGTNPAPIPDYRIDGPTGTQDARQQPAIRLTLASPYSLPMTGSLTLAFNSEVFADDPAVQFATGGRTVAFAIPAGQTEALFPDGTTQVRLQTGTVAGTLTLTPSFATEGGVSLTPQNPAVLRFGVAQSAPRVLNVTIGSKTANSFTVLITGYSTPRSVQRVNLTFTARSGEQLQSSTTQINVESSFLAWFQSTASVPYGSLFSVSIPLTLSGEVIGQNLTLADTITSVAATLTNAIGTSNSMSADVK